MVATLSPVSTNTLSLPLVQSAAAASRYSLVRIGPEDAVRRILQVADNVRWNISSDRKGFNCSVTLLPMKIPVVARCTHVFEESVLLRIMEEKSPRCPTCRASIESFTLDRVLQDEIARSQEQDLIPTFALFEEKNEVLTSLYFEIALSCFTTKDALLAYHTMLRYTRDVVCYMPVPLFYMQLHEFDKASLSYLQLALYQLEAGNRMEAVAALESAKEVSPTPLRIGEIVAGLTLSLEATEELVGYQMTQAQALAVSPSQEDRQEAVSICKQAIAYHPDRYEAYMILCVLLENPEEKKYFLLQAAEYAAGQGNLVIERDFRDWAARVDCIAALSVELWTDPAAFRDRLPPYPADLEAFLEEGCTMQRGRKKKATHIVFPVFPTIMKEGVSVPLTLDSLAQMDRESGGTGYRILSKDSSVLPPVQEFYWGVMTMDVLEGSRNATYEEMQELLAREGYQMPGILDAAVAAFWHRRCGGRRCFSDKTYTLCQPKTADYSWAAGGFTEKGLHILNVHISSEAFGVAGFRKFRA